MASHVTIGILGPTENKDQIASNMVHKDCGQLDIAGRTLQDSTNEAMSSTSRTVDKYW
jgi:hypothetical protein